MNAPYTPGSGLGAALNRRWVRLAARQPMRIDLDHAIVTFTFDDFPKSAATTGAAVLERHGWRGTYYASAGYAGGETHHGASVVRGGKGGCLPTICSGLGSSAVRASGRTHPTEASSHAAKSSYEEGDRGLHPKVVVVVPPDE